MQPVLDQLADLLPWALGAFAYLGVLLLALGLCKAAARGDRP